MGHFIIKVPAKKIYKFEAESKEEALKLYQETRSIKPYLIGIFAEEATINDVHKIY